SCRTASSGGSPRRDGPTGHGSHSKVPAGTGHGLPSPKPPSGSKLQLANIVQNLPEGRLRGATHGSICIQEGQPFDSAWLFPIFHQTIVDQLGAQLGVFVRVSSF